MKNNELIEALNYYEIEDIDYINKCKNCLNFINSNKKVLEQFNFYHSILFIDKSNKIRELWKYKRIEELFKQYQVDYFITNILLLSGYKFHEENMIKRGFDKEQINIHKVRVKEALLNDIIKRKYDGIRISQMLWGAYFINCRLIEIGRLQYEYFNDNVIKIHIPNGGKLNIDLVKQSLKSSRKFIEKYFNTTHFNYYCNSWILSKQIHELVDKNSDIYKFYELFDVEEGEECLDDILNFVFEKNNIVDYNKLSERTSLEVKIKDFLMSNKQIKIGQGKLKLERKINDRQ